MKEPEQWDYLKEETLTRKRKKDMYYLQSLSLQHERGFATILICPIYEKRIPHGDHLLKGCKCWRENRTIFASEAA